MKLEDLGIPDFSKFRLSNRRVLGVLLLIFAVIVISVISCMIYAKNRSEEEEKINDTAFVIRTEYIL